MKNCNVIENETTHRILPIAYAAALAVTLAVALTRPAHADEITVPPVPDNLHIDAGNTVFLVGHATGTQNYICLPSGTGFKYTLFTPQATLFSGGNKQIITHYFSPNPQEPGNPIRATWQFKDTSIVWAKVVDGDSSTDERFVAKGAVAWLKLTRAGGQDGPSGGDTLTDVTFVQRLNTQGGLAPKDGCASSADVGREAFQPYTADYFFYKKSDE
jgi:Protein of unknown function (DUF3455)